MQKVALRLSFVVLAALVAASNITSRATGGYVQNPSGSASFTQYTGCGSPGMCFNLRVACIDYDPHSVACGISATGFTAAINQLTFGSAPGSGAGDACGRCFRLTGTEDPFSPSFSGPFNSVVVKVTDLCPVQGNEEWCGQTTSSADNQHGQPFQ